MGDDSCNVLVTKALASTILVPWKDFPAKLPDSPENIRFLLQNS